MSTTDVTTAPGAPRAPETGPSDHRALRLAEASGLIVMTIVLAAFFGLLPATSETFLTTANLRVAVVGEPVLLVVAMGV